MTERKEQRARRYTRRTFLAIAGSALLAAVYAACRQQLPTPTPTARRQPAPTPTFSPTYTPTATATPTPTPTAPPTPEPTQPPPPPTPTPTPTATPFPPGPPTKLGFFVAYHRPLLFDLLATRNVAVVKTLELDPNFLAEIKRISPQTVVVARLADLPENLDWVRVQPEALAREFVNRVLPLATDPRRGPYVDAWEAYNEPVVVNAEAMKRLAAFEAERTRLLGERGIRSCIGNFPAGHPELELWPHFYPALEAAKAYGGFLGLHEYSAPYLWFGYGPYQLQPGHNEGDEGWLTLRYRKAYRHYLQPAGLAIPLVITELGIDGAIRPRPGPEKARGWQDFIPFWYQEGRITTTPEGFYVEQLAWYDSEIQRDPYVIGAAIYALAAYGEWQSFEITARCAAILKQYLSVHPPR